MNSKDYKYVCPYSEHCPLRKKCHVLTTVIRLTEPLMVKQICPALGKKQDGRKREIVITIE